MLKTNKRTSIAILLIIIAFILSACEPAPFRYRNNDVDLHVIAVSSLLGVSVSWTNEVLILETDEYGRKLFAFEGNTCNGTQENGRISAFLISQKTTETESFYYDNINFIYRVAQTPIYKRYGKINANDTAKWFTKEQIDALKSANDWNKPLSSEKFFKVKIQRTKPDTVSNKRLRKAFNLIADDELFENSCIELLTEDASGRSIYFFRIKLSGSKRGDYIFEKSYVIMFDKNDKVEAEKGIMEIENVWDYQEQLSIFKSRNNWNS